MKNWKQKVSKVKEKMLTAVAAGSAAITLATQKVYANGLKSPVNVSGKDIYKGSLMQFAQLCKYGGGIAAAVGLTMFFFSFKDEDSAGKIRAGLVIAAGIGIFSMEAIFKAVKIL